MEVGMINTVNVDLEKRLNLLLDVEVESDQLAKIIRRAAIKLSNYVILDAEIISGPPEQEMIYYLLRTADALDGENLT